MKKHEEHPGISKKNGRYRVRITVSTHDGRRLDRQLTLPSDASLMDAIRAKEELREKMTREAEAKADRPPTLERMHTVGDYALYWFDMRAPTLTRKSIKSYFSHLDHHILPHIGEVEIVRLSRSHVVQLVATMDKSVQADGTGYSRSTRRGWWRVARPMLEDLAAEFGIPNPTRRVSAPRIDNGLKRRKHEKRTLTAVELARVLKVAQSVLDGARFSEVLTMATTGMRIGELYGLKWSDIDYEAGEIHVQRSATEGRLEDHTKTGYSRTAPLSPVVAAHLREHRKQMMKQNHPGLEINLVFPSDQGTARYANSIYKPLDKVSMAARLDFKLRTQVFRRTVNTLLLTCGTDGIVGRSILGHSDAKMTEWYAGVGTGQKQAAVDAALDPVWAALSAPKKGDA